MPTQFRPTPDWPHLNKQHEGNRTMTIYAQHSAAFPNVAAYVIMLGSERVATIAFKFPKDGAGRLHAYVHWIGEPMARGFAAGGGYDKRSAACVAAIKPQFKKALDSGSWCNVSDYNAFMGALYQDDGREWHNRLREAGFEVFQAV